MYKGPLVKTSSLLKTAALFALTTGLSAPALASEAGGGEAPLDQLVTVCSSCHGEHGAKPIMGTYPVLAGQHANYLEHALKDYRSGARKNAVMKGQAANLSDADIKALAHYFSTQESPLYTFSLPAK
jgi:cytochrome c553